ncbi:SoxR reducing system RseC family protein [uncultured Anaerococcus sp.]|uniref:SoxR reducing system RseC family protein n=1 Tax=uncultured Anaerococcus sp. TaxID=293428 RepID=UPI00262FE328|nr:SoxR reducing system RseC family protein [uncultured Anaerococcus sp.]
MTTMIKEGTVLKNNNGKLTISVARSEACGACAAKETCGKKEETIIEVFSADNISSGDKVLLESKSQDITKYSIYVYVFPVVMIVLGALLANTFFKNSGVDVNLITLLSILVFFAISIAVVKTIDNRLKNKSVMKVRKI